MSKPQLLVGKFAPHVYNVSCISLLTDDQKPDTFFWPYYVDAKKQQHRLPSRHFAYHF